MCDLIDKLCMGIHFDKQIDISFIYPILAYHHLQFVSMITSGGKVYAPRCLNIRNAFLERKMCVQHNVHKEELFLMQVHWCVLAP